MRRKRLSYLDLMWELDKDIQICETKSISSDIILNGVLQKIEQNCNVTNMLNYKIVDLLDKLGKGTVDTNTVLSIVKKFVEYNQDILPKQAISNIYTAILYWQYPDRIRDICSNWKGLMKDDIGRKN